LHKQGQVFGICLANKVFKPAWAAKGGVEGVLALDAHFCQVSTQAENMLFILHGT